MSTHAVGLICNTPFDLTQKSLQSLLLSDQPKTSYDFFIIDNTGNEKHNRQIKNWVHSQVAPVKALIVLGKTIKASKAWNLFFNLAQDYDYRTKIDSGVVLYGTPVALGPVEKTKPVRGPSPGDSGANPGSIPSASMPMGASSGIKVRERVVKNSVHSCFLSHLTDCINTTGVGIASLVPLQEKQNFMDACKVLGAKNWRGAPCLVGKCLMVGKTVFDKVGYFDERLPHFVDLEYSQRCMGNAINVGYAANYWALDFAANAVPIDVLKKNELLANQVVQTDRGFCRDKLASQWMTIEDKLHKQISSSVIINML